MSTKVGRADVGVAAPDIELSDENGGIVLLSSLWAKRPLVLVLLGDLGNPFSTDHAAQLRDARVTFDAVGASVVAVCNTAPSAAVAFCRQWSLDYVLLSGSDDAYTAFGVEGSADFVIDAAGIVHYVHRSANLADYPPTSALFAACCAITGLPMPYSPPAPVEHAAAGEMSSFRNGVASADPVGPAGFTCSKCGCVEHTRDQVSTAGGFLSRMFNVQHRKFIAISCGRCGYADLYRRTAGALGNVVDFLSN